MGLRHVVCFVVILLFSKPGFSQYSGAAYESIKREFDQEQYEHVLEQKASALAMARLAPDSAAANIYSFIGFSHHYLGEVDSALTFFERELTIRENLKPIAYRDFSNTLYNLMAVYNQAGLFSEAVSTGERLLAEDRTHFGSKSKEFGESALYYLRTLTDQGNFRKAKEEAEEIMSEIGSDSEIYPLVQNRYADALAGMGEYSKAERVFAESLRGIRAMADQSPLEELSMSVNMANLFVDEGQYVEAEEIYSNALKAFKGFDTPEATEMYYASLNNMAIALLKLSRTEEAVRYFDELVAHDKDTYGKDHPYFVRSLNNAGTAFTDAGDFVKAQAYLESALQLEAANSDQSYEYGSILNNLGKLYYWSGNAKQAIPLLERAAAIFEKEVGKETLEYSTTMFNLGVALMMLKSPIAKDRLSQSLQIRQGRFGAMHPKVGETYSKLAVYEWMVGNTKGAIANFQSTFTNYYQQIERYFPGLSEAEKTRFYYAGLKPTFEIFNSFVAQNHVQNPATLGQLYDVQLNTKGLILYSTNKVRSNILKSGDKATLAKYEEWLALREQISKLYSSNDDSQAKTLDSLERVANDTERELTKKSSSFDKNLKRKWISWKDVQAKLGPDDVAIEMLRFRDYTPDSGGYYTGQVKYAALLVKKNSKNPELVMVPNVGNRLEKQNLSFYRNAIKFEMEDTNSFGLYWKPIADKLGKAKKVYFSPDGVYNQINLNSLKNPATGKYVLEETIIENVTNTKDIYERTVTIGAMPQNIFLFGFPQYAIGNGTTVEESQEVVTRKINRGERAGILRFLRGENGIALLPGTKEEIQKVRAIVEKTQSKPTVRLGTEAQENSLKSLDRVDLLHVATHGFFLDDPDFSMLGNADKYIENPLLRAGLIMAGAEDYLRTGSLGAEGQQDGILTAREVMDLSLDNAGLVVLSACETGLGTVQNGEGVYGLRRAFQIAGAKCMIMSLWNVDDQATQELMTNFYTNWTKGQGKQEAFRNAQMQLKEHYPNPFYWSAFLMVGE
jgi:tetratricopeptide (TPR) repeat protein